MNEQLQTSLAELINKSVAGIDKAQDFLMAELPDVIQQLLMWHGVYSFILFVVGMLLAGFIIVLNIYFCNKAYKDWDKFNNYCDGCGIVALLLITLVQTLVLMIPLACCLNLQWLQIWIAPKVWLIEYAAKMIK